MAKWDDNHVFTLDDISLLRAIAIVEGIEEGAPASFSRPAGDNRPIPSPSAIQHYIIDKAAFQIVKDNEHLRTLLKNFLSANVRVASQKVLIANERRKGFLTRWIRKNMIRNLEADLEDLEVSRNEAFKKYDMLRRLTDWENTLLKRYLS